MPRCPNGHDTGFTLFCPDCGSRIQYRDLLRSLDSVPVPHVSFEETSVVSVGTPRLGIEGVYCCEVAVGEKMEARADALVLERVNGATWLDYYKMYGHKLERWLELVGFERSKYKLAIVDTCDPLSVVFLNSLEKGGGTTVLVQVADADSTPLKQNTSFVALETLKRKGLSYIMVTESFVAGLMLWTDESLRSGTDALSVIAGYLAKSMRYVQDLLSRDLKLGLAGHYFVLLVSASDVVYKSPSDALKMVAWKLGGLMAAEEVETAYMVALAPPERVSEIQRAFESFSKDLDVISSDSVVLGGTGSSGLFDLFLIAGVSEPRAQMTIERGYRIIIDAAADLEVEGLEKTA